MTRRSPLGHLLALEGTDGVGKSTLQRALVRSLRARGLRVGTWREPVDPTIGHRAQALGRTDPLASAIEFTVDRWIALPRLESLLARTDLVISDRSFYSTIAYQGSALRTRDRRGVERLQLAASRAPDRVLLLCLPVGLAMARLDRRGTPRAPLERARMLRRVDAAYRSLARRHRWWRLDAARPPAELARDAERRVLAWLGTRRRRPRRPRG